MHKKYVVMRDRKNSGAIWLSWESYLLPFVAYLMQVSLKNVFY